MIRLRPTFAAVLAFGVLSLGPVWAQQDPGAYCKAHAADLKCKAYVGAESRAHSGVGNTGGRQQFMEQEQTQSSHQNNAVARP